MFSSYFPELTSWLAPVDSINVEHGHERGGKEGLRWESNARAYTQKVEMGGNFYFLISSPHPGVSLV